MSASSLARGAILSNDSRQSDAGARSRATGQRAGRGRGPRTVAVSLTWPFQRAYDQLGVSKAHQLANLERYGIPLNELGEPTTRLPLDEVLLDLQEHIDLLGRPDVGLLAGAAALPGDFGAIELAARVCSTGLEGLEVIAQNYGLYAEGLHLAVEPREDLVTVRLWCDPDIELPPACVEFALLSMIYIGARYAVSFELPRAVRFSHPEVSYADKIPEFFGCPAQFDAAETAIDLDRASMMTPLRSASPLTAELLRARVQELGETTIRRGLVERIEEAVTRRLPEGVPTLAAIAREFGMSERTLNRELRQAGTGYREICNGVRVRLAVYYLERTRWPIKRIAAALGFSDVATFHRAFKRLTGGTPQQRRREHQGPG